MVESAHEQGAFMPFNLQKCNACDTYQTKYLADLGILYSSNHYVPFGALRQEMISLFSEFVCQDQPSAILEIGGGNGELFTALAKSLTSLHYTIVDPAYIGPRSDNLTVVDGFYEDVKGIDCGTVVMSHVFEHFYDPVAIINKMQKEGVQTIYLCHPDYDAYVAKESITFNVLHCEHTFYISNAGLISLFEKHGFNMIRYQHHRGYSVFFEFSSGIGDNGITGQYIPRAQVSQDDACEQYIYTLVSRAEYLNTILANTNGRDVYMWPCSIHSTILFAYGLRHQGIKGMLDNSLFKIGKNTYGHNIPCFSFDKVVTNRSEDEADIIIVINGGCFTRELNIGEKANIEFIL